MTNLSELLPSGGGAKEFNAVASGTLASGQTVGINSDGTVSAVTTAAQAVSTPQDVITQNIYQSNTSTSVLYDPDTGYTIFVYTNNAVTASYVTVASNSGTTYTVGATTTLADVGNNFAMAYDTLTDRVILCYEKQDSSQYGYAVVGEITTPGGTPTITFGTPSAFSSSDTNQIDIVFDTSSNHPIIVWRNQGNGRYDSIVGNVTGGSTNSITFPSGVQIIAGGFYPISPRIAYNSQENKLAAFAVNQSSPYESRVWIGTVSGNTISWSSYVTAGSNLSTDSLGVDFIYYPPSNQFITVFGDKSTNEAKYLTGDIRSGVYYGITVQNVSPTQTMSQIAATYDPESQSVTVAVRKPSPSYNIAYNNSTASDASTGILTWASSFVEESTSGDYKYVLKGTLIANINKVVSFYVSWTAPTYNGYGKTEFYTPQSTNVSKFIGITSQAIANGATGKVNPQGGVATTQLPLSAVYNNQNFSLSGQSITTPEEVRFKPDGTKFYILGNNVAVYQYAMSTAWDVSTASYENKSFNVSAQEATTQGLAFNSDGTSFYTCGQARVAYQYDLTTAYDISTASYANKSFSLTSQISSGSAWGLDFDSTGTKMYAIGSPGTVYQYTLSSAFDISTASYASKSLDTTSQTSDSTSLAITSDGTSLYVVSSGSDQVFKYTLSTAFDLATASYSGFSFTTTTQDNFPYGVAVKTDETQLYVTGSQNDSVYQYSLSTSLTTGLTYYVQNDGNLSTTSSSVTAGKAISTTQLILNGAS